MRLSDLVKEKEPVCNLDHSDMRVPRHRAMIFLDSELHYTCCDSRDCEFKYLNEKVHRHECSYKRIEKEYCK